MKIKNLLFQPLTLHLSVGGEGLHINAREVREILEDRISDEICLAAARGFVSLVGRVGDSLSPASSSKTDRDEPESTAVRRLPVSRKKGKAR